MEKIILGSSGFAMGNDPQPSVNRGAALRAEGIRE
jgi:hypothetical protein